MTERKPKPLKVMDPECESRLVALERQLGEQALRLRHLEALAGGGPSALRPLALTEDRSEAQLKADGDGEPGEPREPALVQGFQRLMAGRCPYCGFSLSNVSLRGPGGRRELHWACPGACNP